MPSHLGGMRRAVGNHRVTDTHYILQVMHVCLGDSFLRECPYISSID